MKNLIISFIAWQISMSLYAQSADDSTLIVTATTDFTIDGSGTSPSWDSTDWINIPQRVEEGIKAKSALKMLYSPTGVYFLFHCEDERITATFQQDNLNLWTEDVIELFLWTDEQYPVYFEYELSPLNYELPIMVPNFGGEFKGWLPWQYTDERKIQHFVKVNGGQQESGAAIKSWTAEIFIPYAVLKPLQNVPPTSATQWRANFYRIDYDGQRSIWSWQSVEKTFHEYKKFGRVKFQ